MAQQERNKLPTKERAAIFNAVQKLESLGPDLPSRTRAMRRGPPDYASSGLGGDTALGES